MTNIKQGLLPNTRRSENAATSSYYTASLIVEDPTLNELGISIKRLKNNKASRKDNIPAECIKHGGDTVHQ